MPARIGGTLPYMAPEELAVLFEKAHAAGRRYDPRSDLFSLGVIGYELLTGKLPFGPIPDSSSFADLATKLHQRQKQGPPPIREHNGHVDCRLAPLIGSCLAFEPDRRPETAQGLATGLRRELPAIRRARRWIGAHPKPVGATAGFFLVVMLSVVLFLALHRRIAYASFAWDVGIATGANTPLPWII